MEEREGRKRGDKRTERRSILGEGKERRKESNELGEREVRKGRRKRKIKGDKGKSDIEREEEKEEEETVKGYGNW